jgi:opine dehydrogenase
MKINEKSCLVVGAGNIGLASAAYLSKRGYQVSVYTRHQTSMTETRTIHSIGSIAPGTHPIIACSSNLLELVAHNRGVLPGKVVIGCRGNDVEEIACKLAPHVYKDMSVLLICSSRFAALFFLKTLKKWGVSNDDFPAIADFETSPFVSRGNADNTVNISAFKKEVYIAAQTSEATDHVLEDFREDFTNLCPAASSLELNMHKCDDIVHIPLLLTGWINLESGNQHNIYRTATEATTNLIIQLDQERLAVGEVLGYKLIDMCTGYQESYGTPGPSLLEHFNQISAYSNAAVQDAYHRFLFEDIPFGAVPLQSLARFAGVQTPLLDACITFAYRLLNLPPAWILQAEDFK